MIKRIGFVFVFFIFGVLLWFFFDSTTVFHNKLLKNEQRFRDSIVQNIIDLQKQRENITRDIEALQSRIDIQTEEIKRQIRNIKINIDVPKINYNNLSDSALVARILAN